MSEALLDGMAQTDRDRPEALLRAGNTNCGGCGMSLALQMLSRAAADRPIQMVIPACCGIVTAGPFPVSAYAAPVVASTFAAAAAVADVPERQPVRAGGADAPIKTVRRDEPKIGRNDPCWCGSGKKFKKCHGQ